MDKRLLGARVRQARNKKHLTTEQLAELIESSDGYIRQIEYGQRMPSIPLLVKLSAALDTSFDFLLCDYKTALAEPVILNELTRKMQGLETEQLQLIDAVVRTMISQMKKKLE